MVIFNHRAWGGVLQGRKIVVIVVFGRGGNNGS
jgi:hypothetical protein